MEQDNKDQSLRDAMRDVQDAMRDRNQVMQQMLQTMQAMMARMEVQNHAQPIRVGERDGIDGGRERGFENLEAPPIRREQQRHDVGLPRYVDQPPYFEHQNRWKDFLERQAESASISSRDLSPEEGGNTLADIQTRVPIEDGYSTPDKPPEICNGFQDVAVSPHSDAGFLDDELDEAFLQEVDALCEQRTTAKKQRPKNKSSRTVVIRNINYISSKGKDGGSYGSPDESLVKDDFLDGDFLKDKVENVVDSIQKHHQFSRHRKKERCRGMNSSKANNGENCSEAKAGDLVKSDESWQAFQNILMKEEESDCNKLEHRSRGKDDKNSQHNVGVGEEYIIIKDPELTEQSVHNSPLDAEIDIGTKHQPVATDSIIITAMDANIPDGRHMENFECNENYCRSMQRNQGFNEDLSHMQSTKPAGNVQDTSNYVKESFVLKNQRAEDWFVVNRSDRLPEAQSSAEHTIYEDDQAQAIHASYPQHRSFLIDETIQLLRKLQCSKRALRAYHLPDEEQKQIQMITALLIQLVQFSANLPESFKTISNWNDIVDSSIDASYPTKCHEAATEACCLFWTSVLQRFTKAKAQDVSESKMILENLVMDLLTTLNLPEYPASTPILEVLCVLLLQNAGLKSKDIAARCVAIDLLGVIAARLKHDAVICNRDSCWILRELVDGKKDVTNDMGDACSVCLNGSSPGSSSIVKISCDHEAMDSNEFGLVDILAAPLILESQRFKFRPLHVDCLSMLTFSETQGSCCSDPAAELPLHLYILRDFHNKLDYLNPPSRQLPTASLAKAPPGCSRVTTNEFLSKIRPLFTSLRRHLDCVLSILKDGSETCQDHWKSRSASAGNPDMPYLMISTSSAASCVFREVLCCYSKLISLPDIFLQTNLPVLRDLLEAFQPVEKLDHFISGIQPFPSPGHIDYLYCGVYSLFEGVMNTGSFSFLIASEILVILQSIVSSIAMLLGNSSEGNGKNMGVGCSQKILSFLQSRLGFSARELLMHDPGTEDNENGWKTKSDIIQRILQIYLKNSESSSDLLEELACSILPQVPSCKAKNTQASHDFPTLCPTMFLTWYRVLHEENLDVLNKMVKKVSLKTRANVHEFRSWDLCLPKIEFEFNSSVNRSTGFAPFQILLGFLPRGPLDVLPVELPEKVSQKVENRVSDLQKIHATVRAKLEQTYAKYKEKADRQRRQQSFEVGDLVWVYLPRERYPQGAFTKLKPKKIGPCQVLEKFGDNAYRVELPDDVFISDVFNIRHLTPYAGENSSLRSSFSEEGESDEDIKSDQGLDQPNQALNVPVPATQSQQTTSGKPAPDNLRRSKRLQNKQA